MIHRSAARAVLADAYRTKRRECLCSKEQTELPLQLDGSAGGQVCLAVTQHEKRDGQSASAANLELLLTETTESTKPRRVPHDAGAGRFGTTVWLQTAFKFAQS